MIIVVHLFLLLCNLHIIVGRLFLFLCNLLLGARRLFVFNKRVFVRLDMISWAGLKPVAGIGVLWW